MYMEDICIYTYICVNNCVFIYVHTYINIYGRDIYGRLEDICGVYIWKFYINSFNFIVCVYQKKKNIWRNWGWDI